MFSGLRSTAEEIEKFVSWNCQELSKDKWLCPLSGKKFKSPDFIRKHILNKFPDRVEKVRQETEFYNNYIRDPGRPELPERPKPAVQIHTKPPNKHVRNIEGNDQRFEIDNSNISPSDLNENEETDEGRAWSGRLTSGKKRNIHERLGR